MSNKLKSLGIKEFEELKKTEKLIIIDFWATWCPPCKFMTPIFEELSADEDLSNLEFYSTDVDQNNDLAALFKVTSIPTFVVIKFNGDGSFDEEKNVLGRIIGGMDGLTFKQKIQEAIDN